MNITIEWYKDRKKLGEKVFSTKVKEEAFLFMDELMEAGFGVFVNWDS